MGLRANGHRDRNGVTQVFGATVLNNGYLGHSPANWRRTGAMRNLTAGEGITSELAGIPSGYRHPSAWMLPQKPGALASRNLILGAGEVLDLDMAQGLAADASLTGSGDLSASLALVVSLVAALTGTGAITQADAVAFLNLAASLAGTGDAAGAATALAHAAAALTGAGTATATSTALGELAASIIVTGDALSTANVGAAVWNALLASFNEAGTMGEAMANAGAGGNPWSALTADNIDPDTFGQLVQKLLTQAKFLGLK